MSDVDVNAILLKLVDVATTAVPTAQVLDGRDYSAAISEHALLIGYAGNQNTPIASVNRSVEEGGVYASLYDVTVRCTAAVWDGKEEFPTKRATVQATLVALNEALEADVTLDGLAYQAFVAREREWYQLADNKGNAVECDFIVTVQVFA